MPAYTEPNLHVDPAERRREELERMMAPLDGSRSAPSNDPVLPGGWRPMRTAPKDSRVLLSMPRSAFHAGPYVGEGRWNGANWTVMFDYCGAVNSEPCDPDGWMPMPEPIERPKPAAMPNLNHGRPPLTPTEEMQRRHAEQQAIARRAEIAEIAGMIPGPSLGGER